MRFKLRRNTVVQLFYSFSEAERSLHRLLDPAAAWLDFQEYYSPQKRALRRRLAGLLTEQPACQPTSSPHSKDEVIARLRPPGVFRILLARLFAPWRFSWPFSLHERRFMALVAQSLLSILELTEKPTANVLVSLRQDFHVCAYILALRCAGVAEIERSQSVAHFRQTAWLKTIRPEDLLQDAA